MVDALLRQQRRVQRNWLWLLALLLVVIFALNLFVGPISWQQLWAEEGTARLSQQVLWQLRLPRACLALLIGAGLAMSGCVLQTLLHNPLAEPGLIGVSSGASLAAVLALLFSQRLAWVLPPWGVPVAAFPVTGPKYLVREGINGCLDTDLQAAALRALSVSRDTCRAFAGQYSWEACTAQFVSNLAIHAPRERLRLGAAN